MSDTPRTDANYWRETSGPNGECVTADFARTLERELAALRHQVSNREREIADLRSRLAEAERVGMERAAKALNSVRLDYDTTYARSYNDAVDKGIAAIRALMKEADRG